MLTLEVPDHPVLRNAQLQGTLETVDLLEVAPDKRTAMNHFHIRQRGCTICQRRLIWIDVHGFARPTVWNNRAAAEQPAITADSIGAPVHPVPIPGI
jgi:hypothetical protein